MSGEPKGGDRALEPRGENEELGPPAMEYHKAARLFASGS
jgi:hypothetical protein